MTVNDREEREGGKSQAVPATQVGKSILIFLFWRRKKGIGLKEGGGKGRRGRVQTNNDSANGKLKK